MPNLAAVLKAEIARVARKELRGELEPLKRANANHRALIASLRKRVDDLERELRKARRSSQEPQEQAEEGPALRFRAGGLASHRKRLGLSAADFGRLVGVTGQTIYKWEAGQARPRRGQLGAIAAVRSMGRREALAKLEQGA